MLIYFHEIGPILGSLIAVSSTSSSRCLNMRWRIRDRMVMTRMSQPRMRESALNSSRGGRQEPIDALGADTPVRLRWTEADMEFKGDAVMLMIMLVCPYYNPEFTIARPSFITLLM
jgi:hypothetical protein